MAADYFIHLECTPKQSLGDGDAVLGTATLLELLKARHHAVLIQQSAKRDGHSPSGVSLTVRTALSKKTLTSDQILQGILAVGDVVDPGHCMGVLLWLGCLRLDGKPLGDARDAPLVQVLSRLETPDARRSRTTLDVTPPPQDRSTASLQGLLNAFYLAWVLDVPILMSY